MSAFLRSLLGEGAMNPRLSLPAVAGLPRWLSNAALASLLLWLLLVPVPHSIAGQYLALLGIGLAALELARRGALRVPWRSPLLWCGLALLLAVALSIAFSPYPAESLSDARKAFLAPVLVFLLLVALARDNPRIAGLAIAALLAGFALRSGLALTEWSKIDMPQRYHTVYMKGYALGACLYLPLAIAALVVAPLRRWQRWALAGLLMVQALILVRYQTRAALVAVGAAAVVIPALAGRWRDLLKIAAAGALALAVVLAVKPAADSRYASLLDVGAYRSIASVAERLSIWTGVWEIARERPLTGYGFGWKKLAAAARDGGYLARWRAAPDRLHREAAAYFANAAGSVNPHNLLLEVFFETGAIGLLASAAIWLAFLWVAVVAWRRRADSALLAFVGCGGLGFALCYALINVANGLWPAPGPTPVLFALAELARLRLSGAPAVSSRSTA